MSNGEKLQPLKPIDLSELPDDIAEGVLQLRSLQTKEEWAEFTKTWNDVYKKFALTARNQNQANRNKAAKEFAKEFVSQLNETDPEYDPGVKLFLALLCLSDKELDLAIASFTPTTH